MNQLISAYYDPLAPNTAAAIGLLSRSAPRLTDEQKSIYLKLVELAKAGKIEWESENTGKFGSYSIFTSDGTVSVTLELTKDRWLRVANFETRGEQLAGDLAAIANEQWQAKQKKLVEDFLSL